MMDGTMIQTGGFLAARPHRNFVEFRNILLDPELPEIGRKSFYEDILAELIRSKVGRGETVMDCGANAGRHVFNFVRALGGEGECIAFEPNPAMVAVLRSRLDGHALASAVRIVEAAVGAYPSEAQFLVYENEPAVSRMTTSPAPAGEHSISEITVPVLRLDDVERGGRVSFVKIDVEGHEVPALMGARGILGADRPLVFFECNMTDMLASHGLALFDLFAEVDYAVLSAAGQHVDHACADKPLPTNFFAAPTERLGEAAEALHFAILKATLKLFAGRRIADG
ncbi:FkbM family methyltransferase [Rubrimonas cliftonensis]|nr:FkbM family methyltransferase [Rubrimonas cliftonensis]